jgi:acyl dehydratase
LAADEGRRYAALSGDYNPIHLSPWLSKGFGFPRPILHGMNAVGRAVAAIERHTDACVTEVDVEFRRAVPLPSTVTLHVQPDTARFQVVSGSGTVHLAGSYAARLSCQETP